ncbi:MAG: hypothetical protein V7K89_07655 [Nostoc sp.]|uniref:hypothetical protein n=1 Tax=Nostoc sp. TaxID=1180 RepID=UPI002FFA4C8A
MKTTKIKVAPNEQQVELFDTCCNELTWLWNSIFQGRGFTVTKALLATILLLPSVATPIFAQSIFPPRENGQWTFYSSENGKIPTTSQKNAACSSRRMLFDKQGGFGNFIFYRGSFWTLQPANESYYTVNNGVLTLKTAITGFTQDLAELGSDFIVDRYRILKATSSVVELKKLNRNGIPQFEKNFLLKCKTINLNL